MNRQRTVKGLVALNLLLLAVLGWKVFGGDSVARAQAPAPGGGNYLAVTAAVSGMEWDALYVLDLGSRKLHAFIPNNVQTRQLQYLGSRELEKDLRR